MYIIDNNCAYFVKDGEAHKISFDGDKNMKFLEETISPKGHQIYTYEEVIKKLNIDYLISMKKQEVISKNEILNSEEYLKLKNENEKLKNENTLLIKENTELKAKTSTKKSTSKVDKVEA